jgi:malonyl-CoA O-methyltransferase
MYDRHAEVQRMAAGLLSAELPSCALGRILEIGCGTGVYTAMLKERFHSAHISAVDISSAAVAVAAEKIDGVDFAVCDAESLRFAGTYDLITSNSTFQWFSDLEGAVKNYRRALLERGTLLFSAFGPETFKELDHCLGMLLKGSSTTSRGFATREGLEAALARHFENVDVEETMVKREYGSLKELLDTIRYTGTRGEGVKEGLMWRRTMLQRIEELYIRQFGKIVASYQIFVCRAVR